MSTPMAILKRIVDEGHSIGMHTYSHVYQEIYSSVEITWPIFKKFAKGLFGYRRRTENFPFPRQERQK